MGNVMKEDYEIEKANVNFNGIDEIAKIDDDGFHVVIEIADNIIIFTKDDLGVLFAKDGE